MMNWDGEGFMDVIAAAHSGDHGHESGQDQ